MTKLIAIEGIDGAGKGTQARRLAAALSTSGIKSECLMFPRYSETHFGAAIGEFLNGEFGALDVVHPKPAAVLYACDRFESLPVLRGMMERCDVVVLDRYVGSNLAHQGAKLTGDKRKALIDWIDTVEHRVFGLPRTDLTVLLDIPEETSRQLVEKKDARDYTDQATDLQESDLDYLGRVRRCYRDIASSRDNWLTIHSTNESGELRSIDEIGEEILAVVRQRCDLS